MLGSQPMDSNSAAKPVNIGGMCGTTQVHYVSCLLSQQDEGEESSGIFRWVPDEIGSYFS